MTRNELTQLARELWTVGGVYVGPSLYHLERFAERVAAAEREASAHLVESFRYAHSPAIAQAVRTRREHVQD